MKKILFISLILFNVYSGFAFGTEDNWDSDKVNWSDLMLAVYEADIQKVKQLITNGVDVNFANCHGMSAVIVSIYIQNNEILELLINNGADLNTIYGSQTLMMLSAQLENANIIETLLKWGADINAANESGYTPLRAAAANGSVRVLQLLIENGAEINYQGGALRYTALMSAAWEGNLENVKVLLKAGADKRLKNSNLWSAYDLNERAMEYTNDGKKIKKRKIIRELLKEESEKETENSGGSH